MDQLRFILIHGAYGFPGENWFPWLTQELTALGHEVVAPWFPTPEGQHIDTWTAVFKEEVGALTRDCVIIGHSIGSAFALRMLERSEQAVTATFLVSGFGRLLNLPEFDSINVSFVLDPFDWEKLKLVSGSVQVYHGDNDPYVNPSFGQELANMLAADFTLIPGAGHLNKAGGFVTFPKILEDIESLVTQ